MGWQDAKGIKIVTKNFGVPNSHKLATYLQRGGWEGFKRALTMTPASIVDEVKKSNLRGRGGAGFSTGLKWSFVPKEAKRVYLVVNADESEPGTCKDRELMAYDPHLLFEGMAIASYALSCKHAYIYIRGEMMREAKILQAAIDEAYEGGLAGQGPPDRRRRVQAGRHLAPRAPARTSAAKRRRCSTRWRASAAGPGSSRRSRRSRACSRRPPSSTTSRR